MKRYKVYVYNTVDKFWDLANSVLIRTVFTSLSKVRAAVFPCMQSW